MAQYGAGGRSMLLPYHVAKKESSISANLWYFKSSFTLFVCCSLLRIL
jgi:hypothetical protein